MRAGGKERGGHRPAMHEPGARGENVHRRTAVRAQHVLDSASRRGERRLAGHRANDDQIEVLCR